MPNVSAVEVTVAKDGRARAVPAVGPFGITQDRRADGDPLQFEGRRAALDEPLTAKSPSSPIQSQGLDCSGSVPACTRVLLRCWLWPVRHDGSCEGAVERGTNRSLISDVFIARRADTEE